MDCKCECIIGSIIWFLEGREGIGAIYWVTVTPTTSGGGDGKGDPTLWADVQDFTQPGALVLKDAISGRGKSDKTDILEILPYNLRAQFAFPPYRQRRLEFNQVQEFLRVIDSAPLVDVLLEGHDALKREAARRELERSKDSP